MTADDCWISILRLGDHYLMVFHEGFLYPMSPPPDWKLGDPPPKFSDPWVQDQLREARDVRELEKQHGEATD